MLVILAVVGGLVLLGGSMTDSDERFVLALGGIVVLTAGAMILKCRTKRVQRKCRSGFFEELSKRGFKCDEVFDSGALSGDNNPAVIAVDRLRHEVGVMFYNNPEPQYLISAGLIKNVWSGKDYSEGTVYASFGFSVNGTQITVPTKVKLHFRRYRGYYSVESYSRQRYITGRCREAFNEAVEKADKIATVLKKLTERYPRY